MATTAMGRLLWGGPFAAMRQNLSRRWPVFIIETAQALSVRAARSQRLPVLVWLLLFRPALRLLPGHRPLQDPRCFSSGNCVGSGPLAAGRVRSNSHCLV